jgi:acyl dehydratase
MNRERLLAKVFPELKVRYTLRDTMLYGLGVGASRDPLSLQDLSYVYEAGLQAIPSLSCVLAHPGGWLTEPGLEVNMVKLLHAEQHFKLLKPLAPEGEVTGRYRITGLVDKGVQGGVLMYLQKSLHDAANELIGTVDSTYFLRGDGGCGNWGSPGKELPVIPAGEPSGYIDMPTLPIAALIYRLSGDYNPLHADPAIARKAGFERPILQGLCIYGVVCHSLVRAVCDNDASRLRGMGARFTKPVYPGETIRTEYWLVDGGAVRFRCRSVERNELVLDRGIAELL